MKQITQSLGPRERSALSEAARVDAPNRVITLLTWRSDGRPGTAQIGPAEIEVVNDRQVVIALWPATTTADRAQPGAPLTLMFQVENEFVTVHLTVVDREELTQFKSVGLLADVGEVVIDGVDYARLTSSSQFLVHDPAATAKQWRLHASALHRMKERNSS